MDGVFYTPKYITKYIVENTVGRLCSEKKATLEIDESEYLKSRKGRTTKKLRELDDKLTSYRNWLLTLTICDPACGSGAFLNQALDFLIREHRYIDELRAKLLEVPMVFTEVENNILENNIYGVDINEETVEIARLSLWLLTAKKGRKLTTLSNNIKCGNSLIDDPAVAGEKAFHRPTEFPEVFRKKESFILTVKDNSISLLFLTAVLNSSLAKLWIWWNCPELGDNRREVRKIYFEHFPVPKVNEEQTSLLANYATERTRLTSELQNAVTKFQRTLQRRFNLADLSLKLKEWHLLSYTEFTKELAKKKIKLALADEADWEDYFKEQKQKAQTLKTEIDITDREIDRMVYELYGLTEEEIEIVEGIVNFSWAGILSIENRKEGSIPCLANARCSGLRPTQALQPDSQTG